MVRSAACRYPASRRSIRKRPGLARGQILVGQDTLPATHRLESADREREQHNLERGGNDKGRRKLRKVQYLSGRGVEPAGKAENSAGNRSKVTIPDSTSWYGIPGSPPGGYPARVLLLAGINVSLPRGDGRNGIRLRLPNLISRPSMFRKPCETAR